MINTELIKETNESSLYPCLYRQLDTQWIVLFNSPNYGVVIHDPNGIALGLIKTSWDLATSLNWEEIKEVTIRFSNRTFIV